MADLLLSRCAFGDSVLALAATVATKAAASELPATPGQVMGPFYPIRRLAEEDFLMRCS